MFKCSWNLDELMNMLGYCHVHCVGIVRCRPTSASVRSLKCCYQCCSVTFPTTVDRVNSTSTSCMSTFRWLVAVPNYDHITSELRVV